MGLRLRDVALALMSATAHTGPGTEESKKMLTDWGAECLGEG